MSFALGLAIGGLGGLALTGVVAVIAYRRNARLQQRAFRAERLAELGALTGGLAHEIKNPLSTVQLNLQLLREDITPQDVGPRAHGRLIHRLTTVQRETGRLRDILDDFMRFAGRIEIEKRPVDVHQMFDDLVDFFAPQAQLQKVQLRVRPPAGDGESLVVPLDDRLIKQAILNLMINALQAMPEQGGEIILSAEREGNKVRLQVTDTGVGIPPETIGQIFDVYYSTKKGGTGLGLAITKRVAEEHGGKVYATSEVGKGSVFTIEVPAR
ncbi:two-component sensor histidine kinase [Humisphaera borealis]|uniref:histidine kinase n=1 Tax=Humisphaera borealis TaxID=2807512 RepID=A0A7M2WVN0_9BACT|nr:two-component sensor histidine kinase [Humisphaera borealis]